MMSRPLVLASVLTALAAVPCAAQSTGTPAAAPADAAMAIHPAVMAPLAARSLLLAAARAGDRLVAVGERGHILLSDDNGRNWRQVPVPVDSALTGVSFVDARTGWAVGHDAVILHTADGGESWTLQHADPALEQPLLDVLFADARHGAAVGAYGLYLETADGGASWSPRKIGEEDFHINAIIAPTPQTRLAVGEFGSIAFSPDAGASWTALPSPYEGSFFDALALGPETFLVFGLQGHVFRSEDAGQSWSEIATGTTAGLMGGTRLADGRIILVGAQGFVLTSRDDGRSFTTERRADRVALADLIQAADGSVIFLGEAGAMTTAQPGS